MTKPILFNTEMVQAILEGRKTVTRRLVKPQPKAALYPMPGSMCWPGCFANCEEERVYRPPLQTGDILWVRETWAEMPYGFVYRVDGEEPDGWDCDDHWRPSIHMPREAARIFLRVTNVQVEQLQEINGLHAKEEGCDGYVHINPLYGCPETVHNFKNLWDSTIKLADRGRYGWEANPWVWVIEFKRCEKPEGFA